jgi:uncharacterized membrane protein YoaK (UPF0700 family)
LWYPQVIIFTFAAVVIEKAISKLMLRVSKDKRTLKENLMLASSTAFVSGATNVAGFIAFLAFTTNITGHVATLARHVAENNWHEMILFLIWLLLFFMGAFVSNFLIRSAWNKSTYWAHSRPVILEIVILLFVAVYGDQFYAESQTEREIIIGAIIFSMGLQNSMVSTVSGGLIKSSHLTGLFTDLGSDVSEWLHPISKKKEIVKHRIYVRLTILTFYFLGGSAGGYFFNAYGFVVFYFIPVILLTILYYDLSDVALHKLMQLFSSSKKV